MFLRRPELPTSIRQKLAMLLASLLLVWLGVMLVGGDSGAIAFFRARTRQGEVERNVRDLEAENARLREEIRGLGRDDRTVERIAREELAMGRPDEEVILVRGEATP